MSPLPRRKPVAPDAGSGVPAPRSISLSLSSDVPRGAGNVQPISRSLKQYFDSEKIRGTAVSSNTIALCVVPGQDDGVSDSIFSGSCTRSIGMGGGTQGATRGREEVVEEFFEDLVVVED